MDVVVDSVKIFYIMPKLKEKKFYNSEPAENVLELFSP
jgi:hypothetical protein